jgi:hypothetical protein
MKRLCFVEKAWAKEMGAVENIGDYLRSHATKQHMERSLSDVFKVMFDLNLASTPTPSPDSEDSLSAYVMLDHERTTACVSLRILRATATLIAERAGVEVSSTLAPFILQDVACEIVNIIANNMRTFLFEKTGLYFEMHEIVPARADIAALKPSIVLNLDFQVNPEALISLGFLCNEDSEKKEDGVPSAPK